MRSTLGNSWLGYEHVNTVVVQGTTIVLAREAPNVAVGMIGIEAMESHLHFNVLSMPPEGSITTPEWVGFRKLPFPNQLLSAGMEIVRVLTRHADNQYMIPVTDAGGRFRAVPFGDSIYTFRISTDGTLLSTRFRLIRQGSTATPDQVSYSLEAHWEVQFQASEKSDSADQDPAVQTYRSLSREPVYEPTFELSMVRGLSADSFEVEIVPVSNGRAVCYIFQVLPNESKTLICSLPIDEYGQYDLQGLR